jgi:5-methylcytosine-specific restriction endonuclease McrA
MADPHPLDKNLVFYKYRGDKERWVSHKWLKEQRLRAAKSNKKHYNKNKEYYISKAQTRKNKTQNINLSDSNKEKIKKIYSSAENNHVDHIFPLVHPHFCGLHVPWNLQVLTIFENLSKGNKVEARYFNILGDGTLRFEKKRV